MRSGERINQYQLDPFADRTSEMQADTLITAKAYDAEERVLTPRAEAGKAALIPPTANRKLRREYDRDACRTRHLVENVFARLEQSRAIATRYDKAARNFLTAGDLAATAIRLN
jgi:transposase